jgi:murein DD-endopeptidase MepM/ murein hydrolase activator NlpD
MLSYPFPEYYPVSSPYGERVHPVTGEVKAHRGTDYATPEGTAILSPLDGAVVFVGEDDSSGVFLGVSDGAYTVSFSHLTGVLAQEGQQVEAGEPLAFSGQTGMVTGPHTHVRIRHALSGADFDPVSLLPDGPPTEGLGVVGAVAILAALL